MPGAAALWRSGGAARDKLSKAMLDHFDAGNDGGGQFEGSGLRVFGV